MWLTLVASPTRGQTDTVSPKAPTVDHVIGINYLGQSKASGKIIQPNRQGVPRTQKLPPRQGPNLSLKCTGFGHPRPAELILYCASPHTKFLTHVYFLYHSYQHIFKRHNPFQPIQQCKSANIHCLNGRKSSLRKVLFKSHLD